MQCPYSEFLLYSLKCAQHQFCCICIVRYLHDVPMHHTPDRSRPACMGEVSRFLHKCSLEAVKKGGGLIPGQNQVRATVGRPWLYNYNLLQTPLFTRPWLNTTSIMDFVSFYNCIDTVLYRKTRWSCPPWKIVLYSVLIIMWLCADLCGPGLLVWLWHCQKNDQGTYVTDCACTSRPTCNTLVVVVSTSCSQ